MDEILKSFSLGFLLRSVFAGVFFVLSFYVATIGGLPCGLASTSSNVFTLGLALALVSGVTVYGIHRSLLYPTFEYVFNLKWSEDRRFDWWTFISKNSIERLKNQWSERRHKHESPEASAARHLGVWADYIHLQFSAAWCIIAGAISGCIVTPGRHEPCCPLVILTVFLFVAALVSNWRSYAVEQYFRQGHRFNDRVMLRCRTPPIHAPSA